MPGQQGGTGLRDVGGQGNWKWGKRHMHESKGRGHVKSRHGAAGCTEGK